MNQPIIALKNITKSYQMADDSFLALNDVSLSIHANEYIAITGPSGSGKSTLMNILGCLDTPTAGEYRLNNQNVAQFDEAKLAGIRNASIGFIFQSFNLMHRSSVLENVMLPLVFRFTSIKERKQLALNALGLVGLSSKINNRPNQLSGGQCQRVAIARALVTQPAILLGDEPTGNLDSKTTLEIMQLFDQLHAEGHTIVLVTHEQEIAEHCHRQIRLVDGQIASDVNQRHGHTKTRQALHV